MSTTKKLPTPTLSSPSKFKNDLNDFQDLLDPMDAPDDLDVGAGTGDSLQELLAVESSRIVLTKIKRCALKGWELLKRGGRAVEKRTPRFLRDLGEEVIDKLDDIWWNIRQKHLPRALANVKRVGSKFGLGRGEEDDDDDDDFDDDDDDENDGDFASNSRFSGFKRSQNIF